MLIFTITIVAKQTFVALRHIKSILMNEVILLLAVVALCLSNSCNWLLDIYIKTQVAHAPRLLGRFSPSPRVSDPDMHHGTCVTPVPWCMRGCQLMVSFEVCGGENVPDIPGTCTTHNVTYFGRGLWTDVPKCFVDCSMETDFLLHMTSMASIIWLVLNVVGPLEFTITKHSLHTGDCKNLGYPFQNWKCTKTCEV